MFIIYHYITRAIFVHVSCGVFQINDEILTDSGFLRFCFIRALEAADRLFLFGRDGFDLIFLNFI